MKRIFTHGPTCCRDLVPVLSDRPEFTPRAEMVYYLVPETRKEALLTGKIKTETPGGITITIGKEDKLVPALDIVQVCYSTMKHPPAEFRGLFGKVTVAMDPVKTKADARRTALGKALGENYSDRRPSWPTAPAPPATSQYRIAEIQYVMALDDPLQKSRRRSRSWRITRRPTSAAGRSCRC